MPHADILEHILEHVLIMDRRWKAAAARAERARVQRNAAIADAHEADATQQEIADALGLTQPAISSIIKRNR